MSTLRTGFGKAADRLIRSLAEEFHDQHAFGNVAVIRVDDQTTIARGLATNRLDGYGLTKAMVATARAELRRLGHPLTSEEVDDLLHHAEEHRAEVCRCRSTHVGGRGPLTGSEKQKGVRARREAAGVCLRCGVNPPTNGKNCATCSAYYIEKRNESRARARLDPDEPGDSYLDEIDF